MPKPDDPFDSPATVCLQYAIYTVQLYTVYIYSMHINSIETSIVADKALGRHGLSLCAALFDSYRSRNDR